MKKKGFTLIELLVVIAIIGILAATVLLGMRSARAKARDTARKNNVRSTINGLEMEYDATNKYPAGSGTGKWGSLGPLVTSIGITSYTDPTKFGSNDNLSAGYFAAEPTSVSTIANNTAATVGSSGTTGTVYIAQDIEGGGTTKIFIGTAGQ